MESNETVMDIGETVQDALGMSTDALLQSTSAPLMVTPASSITAGTVKLSPAMPAPKAQAPQRLRRIPVDPSSLIPARRSSTRSIKRKKFDDELVESSLVKTERGRSIKAGVTTVSPSTASTTSITSTTTAGQQQQQQPLSTISHSIQSQGALTTSPASQASGGLTTSTEEQSLVSSPAVSAKVTGSGPGAAKNTIVTNAVTASTVSTPLAVTKATLSTAAVGSQSQLSQAVTAPAPSGKVEPKKPSSKSEVGVASKQSGDGHPAVKPVSEKRSRPSSGKSASSSKGGAGAGGVKVSTSRHVSSMTKSGVSKSAGSRAGGVTKSKSRSKSKRSRKQKTITPAIKDLGRWKPQDDLALITAVQQTNDLSAVHTGVKFSCRFSLKEIEERWYALLYDPAISKIAMEAARQLHSDTVATIQGKALYSVAEEKLLGTMASSSQPTLENFQGLLQQHPDVFHPARTAKTLQCHWQLMKQYHLLPDQTVQPMPKGDHILNLSDIEDFMNDDDLGEGDDDLVEQELAVVDRRNKREIRHLEQELPKWQVLVDSVTGISMPDFDSQTLGVLRGRLVRYLMRSREISLGRSTKDNHVDVDLSLEGPAWKVSRRQGIIKLRNSGDFFIANEGKRPILVDGKPVMCGNKQKLNNNSVVEISCLKFTFLINQDVINAVRADSAKPSGTTSSAGTT